MLYRKFIIFKVFIFLLLFSINNIYGDESTNTDIISNNSIIKTANEGELDVGEAIQEGEEEEDDDDEGDDDDYSDDEELTYKTFNEEDILYKRELTREINLRTKANSGFFYRNREFTKYVIEGVKNGKLIPFKGWEKKERMTISEFMENLSIPSSGVVGEEEEDFLDDFDAFERTDQQEIEARKLTTNNTEHYFPNEVSIMVFKEDLLFHRRTSEWTFDPKSIQLLIPASKFETGTRRAIAVFDYHELMDYLDTVPDAMWRNDTNDAANKKFSIAFKERIFKAYLTKIENPEDMTIAEMYGADNDLDARKASMQEEINLIYFMDKIWVP